MKKFMIVLAVLSLFIHSSMNSIVDSLTNNRNDKCQIDATDNSITISNLQNNCNVTQLQGVFSSLESGTFPNGTYKGYVLACVGSFPCQWGEIVWKGKVITYKDGVPPNDRGTVVNTILFNGIEQFKATIYRTSAPFDEKEAFAIDYEKDIFTFWIIDYIRELVNGLYLGIATIRGHGTDPVIYFLLEAV